MDDYQKTRLHEVTIQYEPFPPDAVKKAFYVKRGDVAHLIKTEEETKRNFRRRISDRQKAKYQVYNGDEDEEEEGYSMGRTKRRREDEAEDQIFASSSSSSLAPPNLAEVTRQLVEGSTLLGINLRGDIIPFPASSLRSSFLQQPASAEEAKTRLRVKSKFDLDGEEAFLVLVGPNPSMSGREQVSMLVPLLDRIKDAPCLENEKAMVARQLALFQLTPASCRSMQILPNYFSVMPYAFNLITMQEKGKHRSFPSLLLFERDILTFLALSLRFLLLTRHESHVQATSNPEGQATLPLTGSQIVWSSIKEDEDVQAILQLWVSLSFLSIFFSLCLTFLLSTFLRNAGSQCEKSTIRYPNPYPYL